MRLGVFIFVVFLLILASCGSDAVARKTFLTSPFDDAKNKTAKASLHALNNYFFSSSQEKHNTMEEKRVVPTGPNPLHNK
ncbi:hypothetical protein ACOSP7_015691 [Xanthoceras sorbifolium]